MNVAILGHVQRGGNPSARDRVLATRLGFEAVQAIHKGESEMMVGIINNNVTLTPLKDTFGKIKEINHDLVALAKILR
jgi:6-phosphofructokinase 1